MSETANIPAIIPAAGLSRRFGSHKILAPINGRPMIAHVIDHLMAGGIEQIIVVLGHRADEVEATIRPTIEPKSVRFIVNPVYETGEMLSSIQCGLRQLPPEAPAVMLALGDQPFVKPATIRLLCETFSLEKSTMVQPTYRDRRGHPIVLSRRLIDETLMLKPGQTLKIVTSKHRQECTYVSVDDAGVVKDVDTSGDLAETIP